jgi:hypothetical protein
VDDQQPKPMTQAEGAPGLGDRLMAQAVEQHEGIRVERAADYERLLSRHLDGIDAVCWPGRMRVRLMRSGIRSLRRLTERMNDLGRCGGFHPWRARWNTGRFALWSLAMMLVARLLPKC